MTRPIVDEDNTAVAADSLASLATLADQVLVSTGPGAWEVRALSELAAAGGPRWVAFDELPVIPDAAMSARWIAEQAGTVLAARVVPIAAVVTGTATVTITNVTQARTIVAAASIAGGTVDTAGALAIGSGPSITFSAGDLIVATATFDAGAGPAPVGSVPSAWSLIAIQWES